jgi:hypothetical protein
MRHLPPVTGSVTPRVPGRTPQSGGGSAKRRGRGKHSAGQRASGTTQPQAPQCWPARLRHDVCPGAEDPASRPAFWRASGTTMRAAGRCASGTRRSLGASGAMAREEGSAELTGGRHARR